MPEWKGRCQAPFFSAVNDRELCKKPAVQLNVSIVRQSLIADESSCNQRTARDASERM